MAHNPRAFAVSFTADDAAVGDAIMDAVRKVRYGSVEVTIHNSRVVQIERKEKIRFDLPARPELNRC